MALLPETARAGGEVRRGRRGGASSGLFADPDVELVVNLTVPAAHAEVAEAALAAGKHVWNEKPITADLASAAALVARGRTPRGCWFGSAPDTFLGPGLQTVRRLIEAGAIGTPLSASAVMQYAGPAPLASEPGLPLSGGRRAAVRHGPVLPDGAVPDVRRRPPGGGRGACAGPTRVIGPGSARRRGDRGRRADLVAALYDFAGGGVAQATFSFDCPLRRTGVVEIAGTEATIVAPDPNRFGGTVVLERADAEPERIPATGVEGGRGIGAVDMARAIRAGRPPSRHGAALRSTCSTRCWPRRHPAERGAFAGRRQQLDPIAALPDDWDPTERTL